MELKQAKHNPELKGFFVHVFKIFTFLSQEPQLVLEKFTHLALG